MNHFPPVDAHAIEALEASLGATLPEDYRNFLLEHNGGLVEPDVFEVQGDPNVTKSSIQILHGIAPGDYFDINKQISIFENRIPSGTIPIGHDPSGNLLCLAVSGPRAGTVYFWDHDLDNATFPLADSFSAFLSGLASPTM